MPTPLQSSLHPRARAAARRVLLVYGLHSLGPEQRNS